ncbi:YciI family protein [Oenococcus alcoholitolerans]|uniref:YciI family protein n=1 Tax=Oenococcus alcoholitolerans TaxID=931074 RepID=UPI003F7050FA
MSEKETYIEFAVPKKDAAASKDFQQAVVDHIDYLKKQKDQGTLTFAGTTTDGAGGLIVYSTESKAEIDEIVKNDPLTVSGLFDVTSHPFQTMDDIQSNN